MNPLVLTVLTLSLLGALLAVILYFVAQKFKVEEDPRIDEVEKMLPGANCGGCGFAGCRAMSEALVKNDNIDSLYCPVAGGDVMKSIAGYLGKSAAEKAPMVATMLCGGTCQKRPKVNHYDGALSCAVVNTFYVGETGCAFGCIGYGDCVQACKFGAMSLNPETGLVDIDPDKCTRCGAWKNGVEAEVIPAGHTIVKVDAKAKTCTEKGWNAYEYCSACDYTTYVEIPASHELTQVDAKAKTCTEKGWNA